MDKYLILYKSKSGFSREYAELLNQEVDSDIFDIDYFVGNLNEYSKIFFFGGLYAVGLNKLKKFKKLVMNYTKEIHVIAVGASKGTKEDIDKIEKSNFSFEELDRYYFHYMRGGFDFKKCKFVDKILMLLLKSKLKIKKEKSADEIGMLNAYSQPLNFVRKDKLKELTEEN